MQAISSFEKQVEILKFKELDLEQNFILKADTTYLYVIECSIVHIIW